MSNTPNLGLELQPSNSLQPWVAYNDALQVIDALLHLAVEDRVTTAPPTTVEGDEGKRWIVGASATGDWAGHDGEIALCTAPGLWRFIPAREGFEAWVVDASEKVRYSGGSWSVV